MNHDKLVDYYYHIIGIIIISIVSCFYAFIVLFGELIQINHYKMQFYHLAINFNHGSFAVHRKLLTHQLIQIDYINQISNLQNTRKAIYNVNKFLTMVQRNCPFAKTDTGIRAYIQCANQNLQYNFYYQPSTEVSNNYATHTSDCDTNAYLMFDALSMAGIKCYVVYTPFHALISWKDSFANLQYWETTTKNNLGKLADLKNNLYLKTVDNFYYYPQGRSVIISTYQALIDHIINNNNINLSKLYLQNQNNAIITDIYYAKLSDDNQISTIIAKKIKSSLQTDITSINKPYALAKYYVNKNDLNEAKRYFKMINLKYCGIHCYLVGIKLKILGYKQFAKIFKNYHNFLENHGIHANIYNFWLGIWSGGLGLLVLMIGVSLLWFIKIEN